jgi:hypothetical protein
MTEILCQLIQPLKTSFLFQCLSVYQHHLFSPLQLGGTRPASENDNEAFSQHLQLKGRISISFSFWKWKQEIISFSPP